MDVFSRKYLVFFALFTIFFEKTTLCLLADAPVQAAIVVDAKTGEVLYDSNADCRTQPASLAKIMSLLLAFKALKTGLATPNKLMKVSTRAASQNPCLLGLNAGESITFRNILLSMITKSANDSSVVLAESLGGSEKRFVKMMNREAKRLGMDSTIFVNPSGWKDPQQLTTARDMAKLGRAVLREYPQYSRLFSVKKFKYKGKVFQNHNKLLGERGGIVIEGMKTGFVCASGFNIVVSASKGKDKLIAVVLGGESPQKRNDKVEWLLSCCFNKLSQKRWAKHKPPLEKNNSAPKKNPKRLPGNNIGNNKRKRKGKIIEINKITETNRDNVRRSVGSILETMRDDTSEIEPEIKPERTEIIIKP